MWHRSGGCAGLAAEQEQGSAPREGKGGRVHEAPGDIHTW